MGGELIREVAIKYPSKLLKESALSENMQQKEGYQLHQSCKSPTKMQPVSENLTSGCTNSSNLAENYAGCISNPGTNEHTNSSEPSYNQQPETLNLPAVLWDKPAGSKIRVPPPVPPRSPRKPIDPVSLGAFEAAMGTPYDGSSSHVNITPERGLPLGMSLHSMKLILIFS